MALIVSEFEAREFRSLKKVNYPMSDLDVFVGANGVGKTNLYRALELLRSAATNTLALDLVREGGLASAMWAGGRRRSETARIRLAVGFADTVDGGASKARYRYEVEIGLPPLEASAAFQSEPQIKSETLSHTYGGRSYRLLDRDGFSVMARGEDGRPARIDMDLLASETALARLEDPSRYPDLDAVRRTMSRWRFYHGLRTDEASPLRVPCPAIATPTLASDGADLASVFATLVYIREDTCDLDRAIDAAFPGAKLVVPEPGRKASFGMAFPEFPKRVFDAHELSDGTLRFLALLGALLAYRLPPFIALNEPETSLHPDLMDPLADLVVNAAKRSQIWLVTHSTRLAEAITSRGAKNVRQIVKRDGATHIVGLKAWGALDYNDH